MSDNKNNAFAPVDRTAEFSPSDISENRVMGIFAYISWLVLVPIFGAKGSPFARFHANQGLVLAICETALSILASVLGWFTWIPALGLVFRILSWLVRVLIIPFAVYAIIALVGAARGKALEIPFINSIKILK